MEREKNENWSLWCHLYVNDFYYFIKCDHINGKEAMKNILLLLHWLIPQNKMAGIDGIDTEFL